MPQKPNVPLPLCVPRPQSQLAAASDLLITCIFVAFLVHGDIYLMSDPGYVYFNFLVLKKIYLI